ncbi:MAG: HNH endonuclease signature motif containing protein [Candidatus Thermoplasmatota archaeon]|nr:HNH endonuclease signature motif containing protein [Candidatus Thermoplasmatota archaeon]MDD5779231.1 HNH endonuclease signature motif containing protein [Candidatus Thermoplasmatota archaeon]
MLSDKDREILYGKKPRGKKKGAGTRRGKGPRGKKKTKRTPIPESIKKKALMRSGRYCQYCRKDLYKNELTPTFHHIDGDASKHTLSNIIVLCPDCHDKADRGIITRDQLNYHLRSTPKPSVGPNMDEINKLLFGW